MDDAAATGERDRIEAAAAIASYTARWNLTTDGEPFSTRSSFLAPVRWRGEAAMLKIARTDDERMGGAVMAWWAGRGAARVFEHDEAGTVVLERAVADGRSLTALAGGTVPGNWSDDDAASRILIRTAARLHAIGDEPPRTARPLTDYFAELFRTGQPLGGYFDRAARVATDLLAFQSEVVVLHGDLHHGNVLWFGDDGWLAIDPKNVRGDRVFDFANIFCNPTGEAALVPGRFEHQIDVVSHAAGIEPNRLLRWIIAYTALSASWHVKDGDPRSATMPLEVGARAERLLAHTVSGRSAPPRPADPADRPSPGA